MKVHVSHLKRGYNNQAVVTGLRVAENTFADWQATEQKILKSDSHNTSLKDFL